MQELSETFWILLTTSGFAFMGLVIRFCLKSKCDSVECGCIKIHRNTEQEVDIEEPPSPNQSSSRHPQFKTVDRIQTMTL